MPNHSEPAEKILDALQVLRQYLTLKEALAIAKRIGERKKLGITAP
jgi:hypothetical protein